MSLEGEMHEGCNKRARQKSSDGLSRGGGRRREKDVRLPVPFNNFARVRLCDFLIIVVN
jgi:hypothetical protein